MSRAPYHPTPEQIELPMLLDSLSDPTRLAIVHASHTLSTAGEMRMMTVGCQRGTRGSCNRFADSTVTTSVHNNSHSNAIP